MNSPETNKTISPDSNENDPTQASLLRRFRHGPLSSLAERFRDNKMPQTLDKVRSAFQAIDDQWWNEAGYNTRTVDGKKNWYLDAEGKPIVVGEAEPEYPNEFGDPPEGSPINRRIMVDGQIKDFTTPYEERRSHSEENFELEKRTTIENIYDFSRVDPADMTDAMRTLIDLFGRRLDATTIELRRVPTSAELEGRVQPESSPPPNVPVRMLGKVGYRLDYVEDVVNFKREEKDQAEKSAYGVEAFAQHFAIQSIASANHLGIASDNNGDITQKEVRDLQEAREALEKKGKIGTKRRVRKAEESYRKAINTQLQPDARD